MTDLNGHTPEPPLVEPTPAPEIFTDGYYTVGLTAAVAKFAFFSLEHDPETSQYRRRIVLRLAVPLPTVAGVHQAMGGFLEKVVAQANLDAAPAGVANAE